MSARKSDRELHDLKIRARELYPMMTPVRIAEFLETSIGNIRSWVVPGYREKIKAGKGTGHCRIRRSIRTAAARAGLGA